MVGEVYLFIINPSKSLSFQEVKMYMLAEKLLKKLRAFYEE